MKGFEMNIINLLILVVAALILTVIMFKFIPAAGTFVYLSMKGVMDTFCKTMHVFC